MQLSRKALVLVVWLMLLLSGSGCAVAAQRTAPILSYQLLGQFPHDPQAYTQGLVWDQGTVFESTGGFGSSSLRQVDLATGLVVRQIRCDGAVFAEGITVLGDRIYQLTWKNRQLLVYDKHDLSLLQHHDYPRAGWGLTTDGSSLIASDGSSALYFLDPETLLERKRLRVRDGGREIDQLNELEYIDGLIFANIYRSDRIVVIDAASGIVTGWLDLAGLHALVPVVVDDEDEVLNGIMYDAATDRLFVTGKRWPLLFAIRLPAAAAD